MQKYSKSYFNWYKDIGKFGGIINQRFFKNYIDQEDKVLDFGCGGGYLIKRLNCKKKYGYEINQYIIKNEKDLKIYSKFSDIKKIKFNKIISNQVLPHLHNPKQEIINLKKLLKKNGLMIFVFTCDGPKIKYQINDINFKCYSWSPMGIGNLFSSCGLKVIKSETFFYKWPPFYRKIYGIFGEKFFDIIAFIYGFIQRNKTWNIRIIAKKL